MDFNFDGMNCQTPSHEDDQSIDFNNLEQSDFLTHYPDIVAELNNNRSYDDLLDVFTTYLGPDLVQSNHVFNPEPTFPIAYNSHADGELLGEESWISCLIQELLKVTCLKRSISTTPTCISFLSFSQQ